MVVYRKYVTKPTDTPDMIEDVFVSEEEREGRHCLRDIKNARLVYGLLLEPIPR